MSAFGPYTLKAPVLGDVPAFFDLANENTSSQLAQQMIQNCVLLDGVPVGADGARSIPLAMVPKMVTELMRLAGFGEEGNAQ
jgi:hypothetical protein